MNHAFILSVHTNFEQIKQLIQQLSFGDVYIHVDAKQNDLYNTLVSEYSSNDDVFIINHRVSVNWSGFSQVSATLNLFNAIIESGRVYDYIHFISGQDLLLLSPKLLDEFILSYGKDKEFIEVEDIGKYWWRIKCFSLFRENPNNRKKVYRLMDIILRCIQLPFIRRNNLKNYQLYKGSQWFSITYSCMKYILETVNSTDYINQFTYTACSDEHFFQILLMNSEFKDCVIPSNFRYIVFEGLKASPKVLTKDDYSKFMNGKYMFARKFDNHVDNEIILKVINSSKEGGLL